MKKTDHNNPQNNKTKTSEHADLPVLWEEVERAISNLKGEKSSGVVLM